MELIHEMAELYVEEDPWEYQWSNRHAITMGVCQSFWHREGIFREFGCGEGYLLKMAMDWLKPRPLGVGGYELDQVAVERANVRLGSDWVYQWDLRSSVPNHVIPASMILLSDVLPYIPDYANFVVQKSFEQLHGGGHLVLTSWTDNQKYGNLFGSVPDGGKVVCEMEWKGLLTNKDDQEYESTASYRVIRKSS